MLGKKEAIEGIELDWRTAGYHPEWFLANKIITIIMIILMTISLSFLIILQLEIWFQIFYIFSIITAIWLIIAGLVNRITERWIPISASNVIKKDFRIHIGGDINLNGIQLIPKQNKPPYPVAIVLHGYNSGRGQLNFISFALTQLGISVISYDMRGHGESGGDKNDILYIMRDLDFTLDYIQSNSEFDQSKVVVIGLSMGAILGLYQGYLDHRVKGVIAMAAASEYKNMIAENIKFLSKKWWWKLQQRIGGLEVDPSNLQSRLVSPALVAFHRKSYFDNPVPWDIDNNKRVLLIHCSDDYVVEPDNFEKNIGAFKLNPENSLLLRKGGHSFFRQEIAVVGKIIGWLKVQDFV
ncbi:MAG: alpha/beta hydrolase [archaeon]|nr:alpha/beta hydrolase [archaeon]